MDKTDREAACFSFFSPLLFYFLILSLLEYKNNMRKFLLYFKSVLRSQANCSTIFRKLAFLTRFHNLLKHLKKLIVKVYKLLPSRCLYFVNSGLSGITPTENNTFQVNNSSTAANSKELLK